MPNFDEKRPKILQGFLENQEKSQKMAKFANFYFFNIYKIIKKQSKKHEKIAKNRPFFAIFENPVPFMYFFWRVPKNRSNFDQKCLI